MNFNKDYSILTNYDEDLMDSYTIENDFRLNVFYLGCNVDGVEDVENVNREMSFGACLELQGKNIPQNVKDYFADNLSDVDSGFDCGMEFISGLNYSSYNETLFDIENLSNLL